MREAVPDRLNDMLTRLKLTAIWSAPQAVDSFMRLF